MPMQPRPRAETSSLGPSVRVCIRGILQGCAKLQNRRVTRVTFRRGARHCFRSLFRVRSGGGRCSINARFPFRFRGGSMHSRRVLSFIPVAVLLTACTSTEPNLQHISLSLTIGGGFHASSIVADQIIAGTSGSLRIASAELVLSHVKLASDTAGCAAESDDAVAGVQASVADDSTGHEDADRTEAEDGEGGAECEPPHVGPARVNPPLAASS